MPSTFRVLTRSSRVPGAFLFASVTGCSAVVSTTVQGQQKYDSAQVIEAEKRDSTRRAQVIDRLSPEIRRLGSIPWNIPEYHDEQRLPDGSGGFGPEAYIFASPYLDGFTNVSQIAEQGKPGLLVAVVVIEGGAAAVLPPTYTKLGLKSGINCLWLAHEPGTPGGPWRGRVSSATPSRECARTQPLSDLSVVRTTHPQHGNHVDYPPVGRFSEATGGQPLLGVKCLNAWCEFGPPGFASRPPQQPSSSRKGRIKGWHDEQQLAVITGAALAPKVRASVIPEEALEQRREADFRSGWVTVATIHLHDDPTGTKYFDWGLRQGANTMELRQVGGVWRARITPATGGPQRVWPRVIRHVHFDAVVPATARWRWSSLDDGVWVSCGQACCTTDGFQVQ